MEKIYKVVLQALFKSNFDSGIFQEILEITHNELLEYETSQPIIKVDNIFSQIVQENVTIISEEIKV